MKLISTLILILFVSLSNSYSDNIDGFNKWKKDFKQLALKNGITEKTFETAMSKVQFLPKVIEYDRFQPEFYEDTRTYMKKII